MRVLARGLAVFGLVSPLYFVGCERPQQSEGPQYASGHVESAAPVYRLAVPPLHSPRKLVQAYQALIDHLNRHIDGVHFELEASRDYSVYEARFRARGPAFLLANPWQTLEAMKVGYHVLAIAGDDVDFRGIFIVRRDSAIRTLADLKGKVVSYPAPTALAACIMPQYYLHSHGIDVNRDIQNRYVGSQESAIMNAYLKQADVGVTWPPPWRAFQREHSTEAAQLQVIWETPPLINNSIMARDDVPSALSERVRQLLVELDRTPAGRGILAGTETARIRPADDAAYEGARDYIGRFEREVRPVERE